MGNVVVRIGGACRRGSFAGSIAEGDVYLVGGAAVSCLLQRATLCMEEGECLRIEVLWGLSLMWIDLRRVNCTAGEYTKVRVHRWG